MKRTATKAFVLVLLALSLAAGQAAAQGRTATDSVRAMLDEVLTIQNDPKLQGQDMRNTRRDLIRKVILKNFDFDEMSADVLGPEQWSSLTKGQRSEFKAVFQDLFLDSYSRLVLDFLKKERIEYGAEEGGQGQATVKTVMRRAQDQIPVDYLLVGRPAGWLVRDVKIDGVSIAQNYRSSFVRIIKKESYSGLLKKMRLQQKAMQDDKQK